MEENRAFFAPEFKFRIINEDINRSDCQCIVRELNQAANFQEEEDGKLIREYVGGCTLIKNSCEKPDYIINTAAPSKSEGAGAHGAISSGGSGL